jgi:predicted Zn-ribbon and HTH transcriptional regulator
MVLVWIGIALGALIAIILLKKIVKTSPRTPVTINIYCKNCGYKTNGLKCPRCESRSESNRQKWR